MSRRPIQALLAEADWWPRALGVYAADADRDDGAPEAIHDTCDPTDEERSTIPLIEKVMLLKGSELFRTFPGEELAGIAELTEEAYLDAGELVIRQGDRGDAFDMVVRARSGSPGAARSWRFWAPGRASARWRSWIRRAARPPPPRWETMVLRIDRDDVDRVVEANPAVARGIYRVRTRRLRSTLARVAAG